MSHEDRCPGCMIPASGEAACPECGWVMDQDVESPLYLPPNAILKKKYFIGRVLGHGGFGITYLAWDRDLGIKLAIKEYLPAELATRSPHRKTISVFPGDKGQQFAWGLSKFMEEARTLARFEGHPGIVGVRDFFQENGTAYLVMAYVEGETLREYLKRSGGSISTDTALKLMMPVMDALREVHDAGLLHRDVSPANIYLTKNGQVKLLDFGAARYSIGEYSKSLSVVLKPGYAPEEQYRTRGKQGPWTDVYAVAATMYRAITGEVPPDALDRLDSDTLEPPTTMGVAISSLVEAALLQALSVRAKNRFTSMRALQMALMGGGDGKKGISEPESFAWPEPDSRDEPPELPSTPQPLAEPEEKTDEFVPEIKDHLVWSILTVIFCCQPFAIPAIVLSTFSKRSKDRGEYGKAYSEARYALVWIGVSFVFGLLFWGYIILTGKRGAQ
ncbi:MAG: hypothetical protein D6E12_01205 [Desulfovibrio sp.]|nr:MAG: hypothetical protein D6E12_01205 [Desulfovibrio sp.]